MTSEITAGGRWARAAGLLTLLCVGAVPAPRPSAAEAGPCMFDPGDATHKRCANTSMGRCHHYTSTCEPPCMFDPRDATYRRCANASMGRCYHYTTTCEPACMFDPRDSTYKRCANASIGKCAHYTTTCAP